MTVPTPDARIAAALWFASHGFGIFPVWSTRDGRCRCPAGASCTSPGKHPITANGFKDATTDESRIRTFLSAGSEPNYGMLPPDGVFVWDVDTDDERARLAALEARHGPLPATLRDDTGNGQHLFLRWPEGLPRPIHKMFGLVTRWGSGAAQGYVVGPLSVHVSGRVYRSAAGTTGDIATLPDAWAAAAVAGETGTITFKPAGGDASAVQVGGRHDWLRDRARFYAGTLRDPDVLLAAVMAENDKLSVPKTREEVMRAIGDALLKFPADPVEEDPETGEQRVVRGDDGIGLLSPRDDTDLFPAPPASVAFAGLLGDCVAEIGLGTDASPVGLLASLVAFCGALMPASAYFHGNQTSSPFLALVGHTGDGRKGTAMYRARDALGMAIGMQVVNRARFDGVASGEGLVKALHDRGSEPTGVLFEEEYATFLAASGRDGSTLDTRMRSAFDGSQLSNRKANDSLTVPEPYWLSGLVAITPAELQDRVPKGSFKSGSGNRWLWLPVVRRDAVVRSAEPVLSHGLASRLTEAQRGSLSPRRLTVAPEVDDLLTEYDRFLRVGSVGLEADMTRRYTIIAFRIGLVHASVEMASTVTQEHVLRALALTEYARRGMEWVFGAALGDGLSTLLLRQLQEKGSLSNAVISKHLIRDPLKRQAAVDELCRLGLATVEKVATGGRDRTELRLVDLRATSPDFRALLRNVSEPEDGLRKSVEKRGEVRISAQKGLSDDPSDLLRTPATEPRDVSSSPRSACGGKVRRSVQKGGEAPFDRAEGAQKGGEATTRSRCVDPASHYRSRHPTSAGWVCRICDEDQTRISQEEDATA